MSDKDEKNTDTEDIDVQDKEPDDVTSIVTGLGSGTFKTAIFLLILFILLHSDVFVDRILASSDNSYVEGREVTTKGMMAQGILLSLGYILIYVLLECQYL